MGLLLLVALSSAACRSTRFPDNPQEHRLARELAAAPDPYYKFLANGVFSRVVGIQPPDAVKPLLTQIKELEWRQIESLSTASDIVALLHGHQLSPVAEAVQTSLNLLAGQRPVAVDATLEAAAVKQGLIEAYYGLFPQPGPR